MCFTSSWSSSIIYWALVSKVSFFSFSINCYSLGGTLLALSLSSSTILCFLAFAAASCWSFCSSISFRYYISWSLVWIFVDYFILSISSLDIPPMWATAFSVSFIPAFLFDSMIFPFISGSLESPIQIMPLHPQD